MTTLQAEFEALPEFVDDAALLQRQLDGQSYVYTRVQGMWEGWQAATERAAKLSADLANDAAIKYAGGYPVDFEQEVAAAIRATGGEG